MNTTVFLASWAFSRHNHSGSFLPYNDRTKKKQKRTLPSTVSLVAPWSPTHIFPLGKLFQFCMICVCSALVEIHSWGYCDFLTVLSGLYQKMLIHFRKFNKCFIHMFTYNYFAELRSESIGTRGPECWNVNKTFIKYGKAVSTFKGKKCIIFSKYEDWKSI